MYGYVCIAMCKKWYQSGRK